LSHSTKEVVLALDACGFDWILVETAGVGQTELDVLRLAQTVLVVVVPESGDSIQVMKAGLMEIADVFSVNKSDRPEADKMVRELVTMVSLGGELRSGEGAGAELWEIPVCKTEAVKQVGVAELLAAIQQHQQYLVRSGKKDLKWSEFLREEVFDILTEKLGKTVEMAWSTSSGKDLLTKLMRREINPYEAADLISS
jgi:LAO/AO transport system kinase